jgi:hypothetical protein
VFGEGVVFEIPYSAYLLQTSSVLQQCELLLDQMEGTSGFMIFGDVFLRNYIVTFDKANNRMGFYG